MLTSETISIALLGSGGAGVITAGTLLLEAAGRAGWYGLTTRSVGPQIRGGEAVAMVRLSASPVLSHGDGFHLLIALDWRNAERFADEIPLSSASIVVADPGAGEPPTAIVQSGARIIPLPLAKLAKATAGGRPNIIALGILTGLLNLPPEMMEAVVAHTLARKGLAAVNLAAAIGAGKEAIAGVCAPLRGPPAHAGAAERWSITGNQAAAMGALRGGVRFAAVYPITPATDLSEWLAPRLQSLGGQLVQAEDEIAAINMVLGASYGGVPALTATSGPGLALMSEALGLAVAAEIPAVVINVMRGGPSTGLPTKSEQSDLNIALHGLHGDAPHLVLAPHSVADCLETAQWAVQLTEALQCPAIVLSDQFLGQAHTVCDPPKHLPAGSRRETATTDDNCYERYALTATGVSPMAIPGTRARQYTAEGLEHNERGIPSSQARDHQSQSDKRRDKLERLDYGELWATVEGEGETAVLTWGSAATPTFEAAARARAAGHAVKVIVLRLLLPARPQQLAHALGQTKRILVVEQSHSSQFTAYLRAHYDLPVRPRILSRPGPLPIRPGEVFDRLTQWT